jgi:NADPH:quinone reductase-like Zn-dependent oxidoreductase
MYEAGKLRPVVGACYRLEDAPRALRDLANRKIVGKAVLTV